MARHRHQALATAALLVVLAACSPHEEAAGAPVIWSSADGTERVVQLGPCVKTQRLSYGDWYTTHTECVVPSEAP